MKFEYVGEVEDELIRIQERRSELKGGPLEVIGSMKVTWKNDEDEVEVVEFELYEGIEDFWELIDYNDYEGGSDYYYLMNENNVMEIEVIEDGEEVEE